MGYYVNLMLCWNDDYIILKLETDLTVQWDRKTPRDWWFQPEFRIVYLEDANLIKFCTSGTFQDKYLNSDLGPPHVGKGGARFLLIIKSLSATASH